ncbi:MAG: SusC/RagA family TonB-linked outer membrane protein, partial [Tannerellaceae bacterium]
MHNQKKKSYIRIDQSRRSYVFLTGMLLSMASVSGTVVKNTDQIISGTSQKGISNLKQQELVKVTGIVKDTNGEPIIGASVIRTDITGSGTTTDADGLFTINAPLGTKLSISYIGYVSREIVVKKGELFNIILDENTEALDEVVVTAYGVGQKKGTLVGAVQQVRPSELKVPSSSLSSSFAGRLAGVIAVQRSGQPGADGSNFWIRGKSTFSGATGALIILDGVQVSAADLNVLDPEVIESFSILKDATATAMYGTLGANGVMVVTTKSGADLDKPVINFRVETAVSQLSKVPSMVGGLEYMELYNEAQSRYELPSDLYSQEKIAATRDGINALVYPNINWYDEMFNNTSFGQRANFNIRGGSRKMDYFMSVGLKHDNGNLKSLSRDYFSYNNNIDLYQYDFVNNLNLKATKSTKISLGLNVGLRDYSGPVKAANDIFTSAMNTSPVDFPIRFPIQSADDKYILWGDKSGGLYNGGFTNPIAEYTIGYAAEFSSKLVANLKIDQDLDMLVKGLKIRGLFSFKNYTLSKVNRTSAYNHFEVEDYDGATDVYTLKMIGNENDTALKIGQGNGGDRTMYIQAMLEYARNFAEK